MSFLHKNIYIESNIKIDKIIIKKFTYPGKLANLFTNSITGLIIIFPSLFYFSSNSLWNISISCVNINNISINKNKKCIIFALINLL